MRKFTAILPKQLRGKTINIQAPIPGSSYVGIELENDTMIITPDIPSPYGRGLISDETNRIILNLKNKTNQEIFIIIDEVLTRIDDKYLKWNTLQV